MIIDLQRFIEEERPVWQELEGLLKRLEGDVGCRLGLGEIQRLHYLYQRASGDLAKVVTFSAEPQIRAYLEALVGRAYAHVHGACRRSPGFRLTAWFARTFPRTFRRHMRAFRLSVAVTLVGAVFGAGTLTLDPQAKAVIMPFAHLLGDPSERVAAEEQVDEDRMAGRRSAFAAQLMTHNTRVSVLVMALGMTFGIGSIVLLFYNGVILGAVVVDYVLAGETAFLLGWLLPHGAVEIPAILIAGQAGLVLGEALIGHRTRASMEERLRSVAPDVVTLICGVAILLIWAGVVESFFSQYHEPVIPYAAKIVFGALELVVLGLFLTRAGTCADASPDDDEEPSARGEGHAD